MEDQSVYRCTYCTVNHLPLAAHAHAQTHSKNPLRALLAEMGSTTPQTTKPIINLGLGDPTTLHAPPPASVTASVRAITEGKDNGYVPGAGTVAARQAIADYHHQWDGVRYTAKDVVLVSRTLPLGQSAQADTVAKRETSALTKDPWSRTRSGRHLQRPHPCETGPV